MSFIVISTSLNKQSKSAVLATEAHRMLLAQNQKPGWLDLREVEIPHCDGDTAYGHPSIASLTSTIAAASCILLAVPIYNYDCGSSAKNLLELTGRRAWEDKTVGFLCAAGAKSSYMSIMSFANSLMLDFRTLIIPRFVYADGASFQDGKLTDPKIVERIEQLVSTAIKYDTIQSGVIAQTR